MATLADIRTSIGIKLQDESFVGTSAATVDDYINQAVDFYKERAYWFNEQKADIVLNINDPLVPSIPSDFYKELTVGGLSIKYSNIVYPIFKRDSALYDQEDFTGRGIPYIYTYRSQAFELYYYPDQAYTLTLRYVKGYNKLVGDTASNDFTEFAKPMVMYNALSRIYAELKQDTTMEGYYTARAEDEENNLKRRSGTLQGTGSLTLYSNLL